MQPLRSRVASSILLGSMALAAMACTQQPTPAPSRGSTSVLEAAGFARLLTGAWRITAASGTSMFDSWHWGPGQHSLRVMTEGLDASGGPWREISFFYYHPRRKEVCLFGLSPYAGSVGEGTFRLEGEEAHGRLDLFQTGHRRTMGLRWVFAGADAYRETLLEATGKEGLQPLAAWDHVRVAAPTPMDPLTVESVPQPSERWGPFRPLIGKTVRAENDGSSMDGLEVVATLEWIPYIDALYLRVLGSARDAASAHLLDAVLYHHTGLGKLRCLALSHRGEVSEGDVRMLEDRSVQIELDGSTEEGDVARIVRLEIAEDAAARLRVWSRGTREQRPLLDLRMLDCAGASSR
jgi:hypothetical protein